MSVNFFTLSEENYVKKLLYKIKHRVHKYGAPMFPPHYSETIFTGQNVH